MASNYFSFISGTNPVISDNLSVHKSEIRGQDPTSDFTTIEFDEHIYAALSIFTETCLIGNYFLSSTHEGFFCLVIIEEILTNCDFLNSFYC